MNTPAPTPIGDGQPQPTDQAERPHGWRRTLLVALLVAGSVLAGTGAAGFAAGRVLASDGGPVRCANWDVNRCVPGLELDTVLATLAERGFECERARNGGLATVAATETDECRLAEYRVTFESLDGQVHSLSAAVPALPDVSLTPHQEAFLSWVAVLPFADQPPSAEAARSWLAEQLDSGWLSERLATDGLDDQFPSSDGTNIGDYEYLFRGTGTGGGRPGRIVLEVDAGIGRWFR